MFGPLDIIIVSFLNRATGLYDPQLATNGPRFKKDVIENSKDYGIRIQVFKLGVLAEPKTFYSVEEFNEANQTV